MTVNSLADKGNGRPHGPQPEETATQVIGEIEDIVSPRRRRCRRCLRPDSRPIVPIGSSRWWDLCVRCTWRVMTGRTR